MKKLYLIIIILLLTNLFLLFLLMRCNRFRSQDAVVSACCPGDCYPPTCDTLQGFNTALALTMVQNYQANHWQAVNSYCPSLNNPACPGMVDARSAWFDLDTLKRFISTIEKLTCMNDSGSSALQLGIRIYYAEYPMAAQWGSYPSLSNLPANYAGLHTLLMIPTYHDTASGNDIDFDPGMMAPSPSGTLSVFDPTPVQTTKLLTKTAFMPMPQTIPALLPTSIVARNHGGLVPPPYHCTDYWSTGALFMMYADLQQMQNLDTQNGAPAPAGSCPVSTLPANSPRNQQ